MTRAMLASMYAGQSALSAGVALLYINMGNMVPGVLWSVTAGIYAVAAIGSAMDWTFDRERRRRSL